MVDEDGGEARAELLAEVVGRQVGEGRTQAACLPVAVDKVVLCGDLECVVAAPRREHVQRQPRATVLAHNVGGLEIAAREEAAATAVGSRTDEAEVAEPSAERGGRGLRRLDRLLLAGTVARLV